MDKDLVLSHSGAMKINWNAPIGGFGLFAGGPIPKNREVDLDVVRGVAILLAMGWHLNRITGSAFFDALQFPGLRFGWAGVDLFFVLSGFLVGRLVFMEHKRTGNFDYPRFFVRRALKLWPVLYLYLAASIALSGESWWGFAPQIGLHVQNFFIPSQAHHLWSLAVEEHFYLFAGLLLPVAMRHLPTRSIGGVLLSLIGFAMVVRLIGSMVGASPNALQIQTQYRIDGLAAGVLLALISVRRPLITERLLRLKWLWAAGAALGICWLCLVPKDTWLGSTIGFSVSWMTGMSFLLLVYKSGIDRWARWPSLGLAFLGAYSYSLYIWHVAVSKMVGGKFGALPSQLQIIFAYVAAIAIAIVMTLVVERPILAVRDRWFSSKV